MQKKRVGTIPRVSAAMVALIFVGITACSSCTRVGPGYVGIQVNMAGSSKGVQEYPQRTGWVFYNPLSETVLEYPTFVRTAVWTKSTAEGNPTNEEISFTNKDSMQISADISIAYQLNFNKVPAFYVKFRSDDLDTFTHGFLRNMARDKFNDVAGKFPIDQIMGDNGTFLAEVRKELQDELTPVGVDIQQLGFIGAPRPPQGVIDSINEKVKATQIGLQKQLEVAQMQAEAQKSIAQAEGYSKSLELRSTAEAEANKRLANSLSPMLIENKKLDKWNGVLPQVSGSGGGVLLNLGASK